MSDLKLRLHHINLKEANAFVDEVHRHHDPVTGHKISVAVVDEDDRIRGVGILGRPVSRHLQEQGYVEVVRVATDGSKNACSMLYGALRRIAINAGYVAHKTITYTLESESGASLRASGWVFDGTTAGGSHSRVNRPRHDHHPLEPKTRWKAGAEQ